jgi:hypothetical protein
MSRDFSEDHLKDAALQVYYLVAQELKSGKSPEEVETLLVAQGIKPETARNMLTKLAKSQRNVARRDGGRNLLFGAALMAIGLLLATGIATGNPAEGFMALAAWITVMIGAGWSARGAWQYTRRWAE